MRCGVSGWANPHDGHANRCSDQSSSAAQRGQVAASLRHGAPSAIQVGSAGSAAQTTCGSEAFATTRSFGWVVQTSRHRSAIAADLTEAVELVAGEVAEHEQLGRERIDHLGQPAFVDLDDRHARRCGRAPSAAAMPAGMFAPVWLVTTSVPAARECLGEEAGRRGLAVGRGDQRDAARARRPRSSRCGSMPSMTRPLIWVPAPRPVTRDAQPAARPAVEREPRSGARHRRSHQ